MEPHKTDPSFMERFEHFVKEEVAVEEGQTLDTPTRYLAILAAQGGCEPQLIGRARGNMNMGNNRAFLIRVVSQCLPYIGYPRSLNALSCIDKAAE